MTCNLQVSTLQMRQGVASPRGRAVANRARRGTRARGRPLDPPDRRGAARRPAPLRRPARERPRNRAEHPHPAPAPPGAGDDRREPSVLGAPAPHGLRAERGRRGARRGAAAACGLGCAPRRRRGAAAPLALRNGARGALVVSLLRAAGRRDRGRRHAVGVTTKPVNKRLVLLACILGSGIAFLDGTVVNVALPAIQRDLGADLAAQQWVVEGYMLSLSAFLLVGGSLDDLFERRTVFAVGVGGFGVMSLACAVAPTVGVLIGARVLQGVFGALLVPSTLAIIIATFPESERGAAIGTWTAWTGISTVVGPLAGGVLIDAASWRWIFLLNVPLVLATLYLTFKAIPRTASQQPGAKVDFLGAALCAAGLAGLVYALIEQPRYGWGDPQVAITGIGGAISLVLFIVHERRTPYPMLPLGLFKSRNFAVGNAATLTMYAGLGGALFFVGLFLQQVAGYSALEAGAAFLPLTVMMF